MSYLKSLTMSYLLKNQYKLFKNHNVNTIFINTLATKIAVKERDDTQNEALKLYEKVSKISQKVSKKRPQKPPFIKNLLIGVFDTDILAFPELLNKEELDKLNKSIESIDSYYSQPDITDTPTLSKDYINNARNMQLFGLQAPQIMGGRELNITEVCKFNEIISKNTSDINLIYNEQLGIQSIIKSGSEFLQNKYFEALTSGKYMSAFCMSEQNNHKTTVKITATYSADKSMWILNGEKKYIINGDTADILIVLAETEILNKLGIKENKTTAFLVEKSFGGITTKNDLALGLNSTDLSTVTFHNTQVPAENIIGKINEGDSVVFKLLTEYRLSSGPAAITLTKELLEKFSEYCIGNSNENINLSNADIVHNKIAQVTTSLYAMESITYLTAGLMDRYEEQDCEIEAAVVKVFSAKNCHNSTLEAMHFIGAPAFMRDHWCNRLHNDALSYSVLMESVDTLRISIALMGLQHAGLKLQDKIKMFRNPLFHPAEMIKRMWTQRKQIEDNPTLHLRLGDNLHPSAMMGAQWLEYSVLRLQFATETLLARYGTEVVNKHMDLLRLSDCIVDIYAMTAVLGRSSRSYCIGLQNGDYEILIANAFCADAMRRVKENVQNIFIGPYTTNDENHTKISKQIFKNKGKYFSEHPLNKNF